MKSYLFQYFVNNTKPANYKFHYTDTITLSVIKEIKVRYKFTVNYFEITK